MTHIRLNRIIAAGVFVVTFGIYLATLSPTVVFWDVGEFIAAAKLMQVPHPPGSPLFLLGARIAMMIPFAADQAVRAHAFSAMLSAVGIVFLYLVIIELFRNFREVPAGVVAKLVYYGAAVVGALSLAFGTTYWDNSIEAEVYGASMFFFSSVIWLVMRWRDKADEPGNERYLLIVAYLIGLSLGVHLLSLLAIFPVLMICYFRRYEVNVKSFIAFTAIALGIFFVIYPGIVKFLPGLMDGEVGETKSDVIAWVPWLVIAAMGYGAYVTYKKKARLAFVGTMAMLLILLGYTTYVQVLIRANTNVPMNENDPSNLARLTSYLGREQYGNSPLFMPRRWSQEAHQQEQYTKYSSDMDFMFRYQLDHMFNRYLEWNYIGQAGDTQDSGVSWKDTWGLPFLLGLFGLYYQFRRDWKMGLVFLTMFIILGPVLALYQNQQEPQPRERDYFYVGAFFVFSVWLAYGVWGLYELLTETVPKPSVQRAGGIAIIAFAAVAVPANLVRINYHEHDRSGDFVAWDYSYNMLQTCEPNAILFTNGDNDTFPLWYLQDVEGVRRDVRIVNLSLVNTPWYIKAMKQKPYYKEAEAVPISLSDQRIEAIQPILWRARTFALPVPKEAQQRYHTTDSAIIAQGAINFTMQPTLRYGQTQAVRVQDLMVLNIIEANQWKRPIYFAVTCSPDSRIGLDEYCWFHGLAYRLEPRKVRRDESAIDPAILRANLFDEPQGFSRTAQYGYKWRGVSDPKVYFDENITRMMVNLRFAFIKLANYYVGVENNPAKAVEVLERMEKIIPRSKVTMGWELESDLALFYRRLGREDRFKEITRSLVPQLEGMIARNEYNLNTYYNPFRILLDLYDAEKNYTGSLNLLTELARKYPNDPGLRQRIAETQRLAGGGAPDTSTAH